MTAYDEFTDHIGQINDLCCIINLLSWDLRTQMPEGGTVTRGLQLGTVTRLAQEKFTSDRTLTLIRAAEEEVKGEPSDTYRVRAVQQAREAYEMARRIPANVFTDLNALKTESQKVWAAARENNDFNAFAPYLERMVAYNQEIAEAMGYDDHPYNALLSRYEPGMTVARLKAIFADLKLGLHPILQKAAAGSEARTDFLFDHEYPEELQRSFALEIIEKFGYDLKRGRLDKTVHPFEISFTRNDVRITTRYLPNFLPAAMFGTFHEAGHALYEQGADPAITRTALTTDLLDLYAVAGVSYSMHEAQSRMWENLIGRSRSFWQNHFPRLQEYFPNQLAGIDAETFYRAVNRVKPSYVRVEADEVTYNFHIMMRVEIEIGLMDGSLRVKDLPEIWNAKMQEGLGVTPPTNSLGVLQDIHWSAGMIGTFCTYTIGNIMSAQIYQSACQSVPGLTEALLQGEYSTLLSWLTENIYRHGRAFRADELLTRATGMPLTVHPYLDYLTTKFDDLLPG